jgi:hypothetical protein
MTVKMRTRDEIDFFSFNSCTIIIVILDDSNISLDFKLFGTMLIVSISGSIPNTLTTTLLLSGTGLQSLHLNVFTLETTLYENGVSSL